MSKPIIAVSRPGLQVCGLSQGLQLSDGKTVKTLVLPSKEGDDDWRKTTEAPIDEYLIHHNDGCPTEVSVIMHLFSCFIAKHVSGNVLDVGCGTGARLPLYVRDLTKIEYIGLDPIELTLERDYPFVCAKIEDLIPEFTDGLFNGFIFSTSLDHIRDINNAALVIRKVAKPNAHAVFWIGLHEPSRVAIQITTSVLKNFVTPLSIIRGWFKALVWSLFSFPRICISLRRRERRLKKGIPLDGYHFHYFTAASARDAINMYFGDIIEEISVPGSNSIFIAVKLRTQDNHVKGP